MERSDDNDFLMRQIKSFAKGLGMVIAGTKADSDREIVFPAAEAELPQQQRILTLIKDGKFAEANQVLFKIQYAMSEADFLKLGTWFYAYLNTFDEIELANGDFSRDQIRDGMTKLTELFAQNKK